MSIIAIGPALGLLFASAAGEPTSWGIRAAPGEKEWLDSGKPAAPPSTGRTGRKFDINSVAKLGAEWGTVTSTVRSRARNRAVGGAPNSWHLYGRAVDIARRPGVRHAVIDAAYRSAGYRLVESLDEGDHSHFAFATGSAPAAPAAPQKQAETGDEVGKGTRWRVVYAPHRHSR